MYLLKDVMGAISMELDSTQRSVITFIEVKIMASLLIEIKIMS